MKNSIITMSLLITLLLISGAKSYANTNSTVVTCMIYSNQSSASSGYVAGPADSMYGQTNAASVGPIYFVAKGRSTSYGVIFELGAMSVPVNQSKSISIENYYNFYCLNLIALPVNNNIYGRIGWGKLSLE